jgi:hypothetical protein
VERRKVTGADALSMYVQWTVRCTVCGLRVLNAVLNSFLFRGECDPESRIGIRRTSIWGFGGFVELWGPVTFDGNPRVLLFYFNDSQLLGN